MPKRIDPEVKARALRLVLEHQSEYPSPTAAEAVANGFAGAAASAAQHLTRIPRNRLKARTRPTRG